MAFSDEQFNQLSAPLDRKHVKTAPKVYGSYIEGWHAIAEANRIFGFDGWDSETDLHLIGQREHDGKWRVDYMAKVTITVNAEGRLITRQGCGFGQGIDKDIGQAHESGLKEAETDARKRALMTFGNQFGLALYDKTQANVGDVEAEKAQAAKSKSRELYTELQNQMKEFKTSSELQEWGAKNASRFKSLPADWYRDLKNEYGDLLSILMEKESEAAREQQQLETGLSDDIPV